MKQGVIVRIQNAMSGLDIKDHAGDTAKYTLDNGYSWMDSSNRHELNDMVQVENYLMGTVRVNNLTKNEREV